MWRNRPINREYSIKMINLVLQQLRKSILGINRLLQASIIKVSYFDLSRSRNANHQIGKAETIIPQFHASITGPDDFRIDERSAETDWLHSNKYHAAQDANLRRRYTAAVARRLAKARKCIAQVSSKRFNFD